MTILPCTDPALLVRLVPLSVAEGFRYLERLVTEWEEGTNRFEAEGEVLLTVQVDRKTIACGGLTRQRIRVGRVRRVYVDPDYRRLGVGRALVETLVEQSRANFDSLVLFTDNPEAARLYERLGFLPEEPAASPDRATHRLDLSLHV